MAHGSVADSGSEVTVPAIPRLGVRGFTAARLVLALAAVAVALPLLVLLAGGSLGGFATTYRYGITTAGLVLAAALAVARPLLSRRERLPWALLAAGIVLCAVGQLLWTFVYARRAEPPVPGGVRRVLAHGLGLLGSHVHDARAAGPRGARRPRLA